MYVSSCRIRCWSFFFSTFTSWNSFSFPHSPAHVRKLFSFLYSLKAGEFVCVLDIDVRTFFSLVDITFYEISWFDLREWCTVLEGKLISNSSFPNTEILSNVGSFSSDRITLNPYSEFVFFISFRPEFMSSSLFRSKISWWLYKWLPILTPFPMELELFSEAESLSLSYSDLCFGSISFTSDKLRFFVCFDFKDSFFSFCSCSSKKSRHNLNSSLKYLRYLFYKVSLYLLSSSVKIRSYSSRSDLVLERQTVSSLCYRIFSSSGSSSLTSGSLTGVLMKRSWWLMLRSERASKI